MKQQLITEEQRQRMVAGGTRIAPGIWEDKAGDIHFSVPELLEWFGWPDDDQHRALCQDAIRESCRANGWPEPTQLEVRTD